MPVVFAAALLTLSLLRFTDSANITLTPRSLVVFEGDSAIMTCTPYIPYNPPVLVFWDEGNLIVLEEQSEPRLSHLDSMTPEDPLARNRTYILSQVTREDHLTRFSCVIGDKVSEETILRVHVPPVLSGPSGRQYAVEGAMITKSFHYEEVLGLPAPHSYDWFLNGVPFHGNARIRLLDGNRNVSVRNALRTDSGVYMLTVVSDSGEASLQLDLQITYNEFTDTPKSSTVEEGELLTFVCGHAFGLGYEWRTTDGALINAPSNKVSISEGGRKLHYGPVDYTDHLLEFECVVSSVDGENFYESSPATLRVTAPPQVISPMVEVLATEGRSLEVTLSFAVHSYPPHLSLTYHHNGRPLQTSERLIMLSNGSILIRDPMREDAGQYSLSVANERGNNTAIITLEIHYSPELSRLSNSLVVQHNKSAQIPCGGVATGNPLPTYKWAYRSSAGDTVGIPPEGSSINAATGELTLSTVRYEDAGEYFCTASNDVGNDSVMVLLLVLDPPGPPLLVQVIKTGHTWVLVSWAPPTAKGGLGNISSYRATAEPRRGEVGGAANSSCVEVQCEVRLEEVPGEKVTVNLTDLIPAISYSLELLASSGFNLQSEPSQQITFTTKRHTPGIGLVTSAVRGPASALVSWSLAYSGGEPVQGFLVEYRRNDTPTWRRIDTSEAGEGGSQDGTISPESRSHVIFSMESEEFYEFRVAGFNGRGVGGFGETVEPLLSHVIGVPSPPTIPRVVGWNQSRVTIATAVTKFGSRMNFSLGSILILNDTDTTADVIMGYLSEDYTLGEEVELTLVNVSYRGDLKFAVIASNYLGSSPQSDSSLKAREIIQDETLALSTVGIAVWSIMGVANIIVMAASAIICRTMSWETKKQKKGMARRMEIASSCPLSPRSDYEFGEYRSSPDGRSHNLPVTPGGRTENCNIETSVPFSNSQSSSV